MATNPGAQLPPPLREAQGHPARRTPWCTLPDLPRHDHGHDGPRPVVWFEGLHRPPVRSVAASWASKMRPAPPPSPTVDSSQDEFSAAGLVPRPSRYEDPGYPQVRWPWATVRRALASMADAAPAGAPGGLAYGNPRTGAPPLPTMGCGCQWLPPGGAT